MASKKISGKDAKRILDEVRKGTPDSAQRRETIRRADETYRRCRPDIQP